MKRKFLSQTDCIYSHSPATTCRRIWREIRANTAAHATIGAPQSRTCTPRTMFDHLEFQENNKQIKHSSKLECILCRFITLTSMGLRIELVTGQLVDLGTGQTAWFRFAQTLGQTKQRFVVLRFRGIGRTQLRLAVW
jgi:hypothetical protein